MIWYQVFEGAYRNGVLREIAEPRVSFSAPLPPFPSHKFLRSAQLSRGRKSKTLVWTKTLATQNKYRQNFLSNLSF